MLNADMMLGIKKVDPEALKEVKIKIPVRQLLRLHYLKLTAGRTFSEVIASALMEHFEKIEGKTEPVDDSVDVEDVDLDVDSE